MSNPVPVPASARAERAPASTRSTDAGPVCSRLPANGPPATLSCSYGQSVCHSGAGNLRPS